MTTYLRPTAPIAPDAVLPSDPAVALALAQDLLEKPLMSNHSHGLWGYSGRTAAGRELTIQSTGIGGASAAAVLSELGGHGVRRAIGIGRCRAIADSLSPADLVVPAAVIPGDGPSAAVGAECAQDPVLAEALGRAIRGARRDTIASVDWLGAGDLPAALAAAGASAVDLESAALLALGRRLGLRVACVLAVAGTPAATPPDAELSQAQLRAGSAAATALAEVAQAPASATV